MPRLAGIGIAVGITGGLEGGHRDVVHLDVVGMVVPPTVVGVGHHDVRSDPADDRHQSTDGLIGISVGEGVRMGIRLRVDHARIAVTEHHHLVVSDDGSSADELCGTHLPQVGPHLRCVNRGVQYVTGLAAGAADQHAVCTLCVAGGDRGRPLGRLVVRVCVHCQEP